MNLQEFSVKQDICFAVGAIEKLPEKIRKLNGKKAMLVSDPGLVKAGSTKKLEDILNAAGIPYVVFSHIDPDPGCWIVHECRDVMVENKCDVVIAFGGGSAMDTAKSAALIGYSGKRIHDYWGYYKPVDNETIPVIAIPTTAGTGSEVTRNTVITDEEHYKMVILNDKLLPQISILDPELITTCPQSVAAASGLDAMIHAVECYLSDLATPFSDACAEKAMELIGQALPRFVANRKDIDAASDMLMGSTLAGISLSLCLPNQAHALSHPMTGFYGIPHGLANAMLFPTTMNFNAIADKGKYKKIYNLLRSDQAPVVDFEPKMLIDYLKELNRRLGLKKNVSEMGYNLDEHIEEMLVDCQRTKIWEHCPRTTTVDEMRKLYEETWYRD